MSLDIQTRGTGPAVILVHGVGLDRTMWSGVVDQLENDFRCITFDLPGHGVAPIPSGDPTLATYAAALADVVASCGVELPSIVGYSMGAMTALHFVGHRPDAAKSLVLMNAVHDRDSEQSDSVQSRLAIAERDGPDSLIEVALARWFNPDFTATHPQTISRIRDRLRGNDAEGFLKAYRVFATSDKELLPLLGNILCPTLALTAELDANSTPQMSEALAAALSKGRSKILSDLAHGAPIEAPERVARELKRFLQER